MNERLLELARQAGLKKPHGSDTEFLSDFDWRDFARLLIQDCVLACHKHEDINGTPTDCIEEIKRQFGLD